MLPFHFSILLYIRENKITIGECNSHEVLINSGHNLDLCLKYGSGIIIVKIFKRKIYLKSFLCIILILCENMRFLSRGANLTFDYRLSDFNGHLFDIMAISFVIRIYCMF